MIRMLGKETIQGDLMKRATFRRMSKCRKNRRRGHTARRCVPGWPGQRRRHRPHGRGEDSNVPLLHGDVLVVANLGLELDEFPGHLVVGALRENPEHGPARLVHVHAAAQWQPTCAAALLDDVTQLHHGHTHQPILPREAVVLHADVQLEGRGFLLVADDAEKKNKHPFLNGKMNSVELRLKGSFVLFFFKKNNIVIVRYWLNGVSVGGMRRRITTGVIPNGSVHGRPCTVKRSSKGWIAGVVCSLKESVGNGIPQILKYMIGTATALLMLSHDVTEKR
ncbi:hypothetical protein TNCV_4536691 [Trichonephila clavipes]|nr:hypothetical protein TNCV_4536691 [Trichonephila clavipes]